MLNTEIIETFVYADFISTAKELAKMLRDEQKCDYIIALTHMRSPNDRIFAASVPEVDLCLGGHDHLYLTELCEETGVVIIKSGTDFEEFSDNSIELDVSEQ